MDSIRIGVIARPHGVHGELKVQPLTDDINRFSVLEQVFIEQNGVHNSHDVERTAMLQGAVLLKLSGVQDRNTAEALRGQYICVDRKNAIELPSDRYFICDLIGCSVLDTEGNVLGKLTDVLELPANDVYVIAGEKPFMVPAIKKLLHSVDVANKRVVLCSAVLREVAVYNED